MKRVIILLFISSFLISQSLTKGWYNESFDVPGTLWTNALEVLGGTPGVGKVLTDDGTGAGIAIWSAAGAGFTDPMTTRGDIIYRNPSNVTARLGLGANLYVLQSDGTDLAWSEFLASEMNIVDAGVIITATEVEGALQENRIAINLNTAKVTTQWTTTGSDIYYNTGNVGIGESSPLDILHVTKDNACIRLEDDSGNYGRVKVGNSQLTIQADPDNVVASTDIVFDMDGSEVARFSQGGNFGIGTGSPISPLEVEDGLTTIGAVFSLGTKEPTVVDGDKLGQIDFYAPLETGADALLPGASIWAEAESTFDATNNPTTLVLATGASEAATGKVYIKSDGFVGIGTAGPNAALEVKGALPGSVGGFQSGTFHVTNSSAAQYSNSVITGHNAYNTNTQLWYLGSVSSSNNDIAFINRQVGVIGFDTNNTRRMTILSGGNVGIGITNPGATLDVRASGAVIRMFNDGITDRGIDIKADNNAVIFNTLTGGSATPIVFQIGGNEEMRINLNGNVGIGVIDPDSTLEANGSGHFTGNLRVEGSMNFSSGYTRHIDIEIGAATLGPTAPTATTVGTFRGLGFDADNEEAFVNYEIPVDWDGASDMTFELHWYPTAGDAIANGETVKWDITYRSIAAGEAVDNGTVVPLTATFTGGASETDKEHYETAITIAYNNGNQPLTAGDDLGIQFDRDVTTDTYSGAGIVYRIDLTYTSNTLPEN